VIHGAKGDTGPARLAKGRDDFIRGARDQFVVEARDVGEIRHVVIGHDNSGSGPSWHLQQVEVRGENQGNKLYVFPCNEWFEAEHGDGCTTRTLHPDDPANPRTARTMIRHLVTVLTSDIPAAATDAGVAITLNGERGTSGPHELTVGKQDFSRGACDVFPLDIPDVGAISSVVISQDGRGLSPRCTTYPMLYTLYSIPYTLYPIPYVLHHRPQSLNPQPQTLIPKRKTLNPKP